MGLTQHSSANFESLICSDAPLHLFEEILKANPEATLGSLSQSPTSSTESSLALKEIPLSVPFAVALFNKRYYWEAHEVLEHVWLDEHGPNKIFLQGFIQASAALYHVVSQNQEGYLRLSKLSKTKLEPKPIAYEVDLRNCLQGFYFFDSNIASNQPFNLTNLPKITFAGIFL